MQSSRRVPSALLATLLFAGVFAGLFAPVLAGRATVVHGDALSVSLPLQKVLASSLARGALPLWSDQIYGGHPIFAEGQGGFAHPLNLLLFGLLPTLSGDAAEMAAAFGGAGGKPGTESLAPTTVYAHGLLHVLCGLIAALGTFGLARSLGLGTGASLFAGLALACSQDWLVMTSNSTIALSAAFAPMVLLAVERWWREPDLARACQLALALVLMVLAGYPQAVHACAIFALLWIGIRVDRAWLASPWRHLATGALAIALAAGLAAVQLLPTLQLIGESVRAEGVEIAGAATPALQLRGLLFSVGKRAAVDPSLGSILVVLLAGVGLRWSRPVLAIAAPSLVLLQLGLADHSVLYRVADGVLPGLDSFRITHLYSSVALIGASILAGFGLQRLADCGGVPARGFSIQIGGVALLIAAACAALRDDVVPAASYAFPLVAIAAAAWLVSRGRARLAPIVLVAVLLLEIAVLRAPLHAFVDVDAIREPPPTARELQRLHPDERDFKIANVPHFFAYVGFASANAPGLQRLAGLFLSSMDAGSNLLWSIPSVNANLALPLARRGAVTGIIEAEVRGESARPAGRRLIDSLGVRYLITHRQHRRHAYSADLREIFYDDDFRFYILENPHARSRLQLYGASDTRRVADVAEAVLALEEVPGALLVLEDPAASEPPVARPAAETASESEARTAPAALIDAESSDVLHVAVVEAAEPVYLFLADAWYPGWTARVDGEPVPILPANVLGKAVAVPPGRHRVELAFEPHAFRLGLTITIASAVLLLILAAWRSRTLSARDAASVQA